MIKRLLSCGLLLVGVQACYAATEMAARELGWTAKRNIEDMCRDQWKWASANPYGFAG